MRKSLAVLVAAAIIGVTGCSTMDSMMGAPPAPTKVMDGVLTNSAGMTLYTFDKDTAGGGKSVCNGPCAANWPPLLAAADAKAQGDYSIITRDDGTKQWAYKGKPLYLWVKDSKPGDRTGDGFNNAWRLARS
jgi:predicted lipoprotein with Yx(FWY)xxD motif